MNIIMQHHLADKKEFYKETFGIHTQKKISKLKEKKKIKYKKKDIHATHKGIIKHAHAKSIKGSPIHMKPQTPCDKKNKHEK